MQQLLRPRFACRAPNPTLAAGSPFPSRVPLVLQALMDICAGIESRSARSAVRSGSSASGVDGGGPKSAGPGGKPWDGMNGIAASVLLSLTASVRFEGALNVDLNEISTNLVPFPSLHFLLPSLAPLLAPADLAQLAPTPRAVDGLFADAFSREAQLLRADPRQGTYLAWCAPGLLLACATSRLRRFWFCPKRLLRRASAAVRC